MSTSKERYLRWLNRTLNPLTLRAARRGRGPFSLVEHVGRRSGRVFEAPLVLARVPEGFVAELTYGAGVNWYRNLLAAGGGRVLWRGDWYRVVGVEPYGVKEGLRAFGAPASWVLRALRRREFRLLRVARGIEEKNQSTNLRKRNARHHLSRDWSRRGGRVRATTRETLDHQP